MRKRRLIISVLAAAALGALCLIGCGKDEEESAEVESVVSIEPVEVVISAAEPEEIVYEGNIDPLTGLYDLSDAAVGKRPVVVTVNNIKKALPQYGIEQSDIIFEFPVEGNQTRLLAIYPDYTAVPKVCSVRSYRYYFASVSVGFDAIYIHWGEDQSMMDYYRSLNMDTYDGMTNKTLFGRDKERRSAGYALEHTSYFDGTLLAAELEEDGVRTDLAEGYEGTVFNFATPGEFLQEGSSCISAYIDFGAQNSGFKYDAANRVYLKEFNGEAHVDGNSGNQLSFSNVIILETSVKSRGDSKGHVAIDWEGGDDSVGYYISGGCVQQIKWKKESEQQQFEFFTLDGQELVMNTGKTYLCFTKSGSYSFEGEQTETGADQSADQGTEQTTTE